jgi:hypothetical protein
MLFSIKFLVLIPVLRPSGRPLGKINSSSPAGLAGQACNSCLPYTCQDCNAGLDSQAGVDQFKGLGGIRFWNDLLAYPSNS